MIPISLRTILGLLIQIAIASLVDEYRRRYKQTLLHLVAAPVHCS